MQEKSSTNTSRTRHGRSVTLTSKGAGQPPKWRGEYVVRTPNGLVRRRKWFLNPEEARAWVLAHTPNAKSCTDAFTPKKAPTDGIH